jgi:hypothetical protein
MNEFLKENLGTVGVVIRLMLGALLLAAILVSNVVPVWVALIAVYPVITAIMIWDPVYAAIRFVRASIAGSPHKLKAITVG